MGLTKVLDLLYIICLLGQKERGPTYKQLVPGLMDVAMALLTCTLNFNIFFQFEIMNSICHKYSQAFEFQQTCSTVDVTVSLSACFGLQQYFATRI